MEAGELYLIADKEKIVEMNIEGNDIEYFAACTYAALRANGFVSLQTLNNKDYSKWKSKKHKAPSMKSIYSSMKKMEKDMARTLKRTVRNNVVEKYRSNEEAYEGDEDQVTSRVSEKSNQVNIHNYGSNQAYNSTKQKYQVSESERSPLK